MSLSKVNIPELDARFEAFLDSVQTSITRKDLTPEKRKERRERADKSDLEFCKIYYPEIFHLPWNAAHRHISGLTNGKHTVSGFRELGKSAFCYVAKVIKPLILGVGGIINISTRTQEISQERTSALVRLMERNRLLMYDYEVKVIQDKKGWYIVNNTILLATSVQVGLRSYISDDFQRFKISIQDDLYNRLSVKSVKDNEKVYDFVTAEVYGQMQSDGLCITLGNSISEDCPIIKIKALRPDNHFSLPALDEDGESTWPEFRTKEEWDQFKADTPFDIWEGEYMDKPFEKGDIFDRGWLRSINMNLIEILATLSAADPAFGKSPSACMKAIATGSITSKQEVVMEDMYLRQEPYSSFFDYVDALRDRFPKWKVLLFENDFSQWEFAHPYYLDWIEKHSKTIPMVTHYSKDLATKHRGYDKESRILNLVHPHQTGMFLYSDILGDLGTGNPANKDISLYVQQYLAYGKATTKLDGLDATATLYIMIFRYLERGSFKSLGKKLFQRKRLFKGQRWRS